MGALFQSQRVGGNAFFGFIFGEGVVTPPFEGDGENPVIPGTLVIADVGTRSLTIIWNAGTDNVGIVGYQVSVDTGTPSYTLAGNVLTKFVPSLQPSTTYTVRVRAMDASGNVSTALTTTVTTLVEVVREFVPIMNKSGEGALVEALAILSTTPLPLDYVKSRGQELVLFNNGQTEATVNLSGSAATAIFVKGAAGNIINLTQGLNIAVPSGMFVTLKLDNANAYLKGTVTVRASVAGAVFAGVLQ